MRLKMDLLDQAYGLLCNKPSDGTSAEEAEEWLDAFHRWSDAYRVVIHKDQVKRHNRLVQAVNAEMEKRGRVKADTLADAYGGIVHEDEPMTGQFSVTTDGLVPKAKRKKRKFRFMDSDSEVTHGKLYL
jgi:hypothetical protein